LPIARLVKKILSRVAGDVSFSVFGSPLKSAVRMGDLAMLEAVMDVLRSKKSKREKRALALGSAAFGVEAATRIAIQIDRVDMVAKLLECLQEHVSRPAKQLYTRLVEATIVSNKVDCLKAILVAVPNDQAHESYAVSAAVFSSACESARVECIAMLLKEKGMDLTSK
jgi:hypothetical protein